MKICPNCGKECADEIRFCMFCGNPFPVEADIQTPNDNVDPVNDQAAAGSAPQQEYAGQAQQQYGGQASQQYGGQASQQYGGQASQQYAGQASQQYGGQASQQYGGQQYQQYGQQYTRPAAGGTNGFAIAALIIGIIGVIPVFYFFIPQILAIIFGGVGISKAKKLGTGKGMAIAGLVLGIIGLAIIIIIAIVAVAFVTSVGGLGLLYGLGSLY